MHPKAASLLLLALAACASDPAPIPRLPGPSGLELVWIQALGLE